MPICNYEGDVVGVAQIINKTDGKHHVKFIVTKLIVHIDHEYKVQEYSLAIRYSREVELVVDA